MFQNSKHAYNKFFKALMRDEINWQELIAALIVLIPVFAGFLITHNLTLFNVGLISISLLIGTQRLNLGVYGITVHIRIHRERSFAFDREQSFA